MFVQNQTPPVALLETPPHHRWPLSLTCRRGFGGLSEGQGNNGGDCSLTAPSVGFSYVAVITGRGQLVKVASRVGLSVAAIGKFACLLESGVLKILGLGVRALCFVMLPTRYLIQSDFRCSAMFSWTKCMLRKLHTRC